MHCLKLSAIFSAMLVMATICQETLGSGKMWAHKGCPSGTGNPSQFKLKKYKAGVRCCSLEGPLTCKTFGDCSKDKKTWTQANAICTKNNLRLCTKKELADKECCGKGGGCDNHRVWTSTSDCETTGGKHNNCVFPFEYKGNKYNTCTDVDFPGQLWCGTEYDVEGKPGNVEGCKGTCRH